MLPQVAGPGERSVSICGEYIGEYIGEDIRLSYYEQVCISLSISVSISVSTSMSTSLQSRETLDDDPNPPVQCNHPENFKSLTVELSCEY